MNYKKAIKCGRSFFSNNNLYSIIPTIPLLLTIAFHDNIVSVRSRKLWVNDNNIYQDSFPDGLSGGTYTIYDTIDLELERINMIIRKYEKEDEKEWVRCRTVSFLDCSYYNDVKTEKEIYVNPTVSFVAEENQHIIGFIDVEMDSEDLACNNEERGAIIWHLGVLPEYRKDGIASGLWENAKKVLMDNGIHYCEVWTQEDVAANKFYRAKGFHMEDSQTWIRCYISGAQCKEILNENKLGDIYGPEELVFDAPLERKEELSRNCCRIDEVRLYSIRF